MNLFHTSLSYSFDHCQQHGLYSISFGHVGTATLTSHALTLNFVGLNSKHGYLSHDTKFNLFTVD